MRDHIPMAPEPAQVPFRALALSVLALAIPMMGVTLAPEWLSEEQGLLLWLTALIPPFLLTYYRGWRGASVGLAAGMTAIVITHLALTLTGTQIRDSIFPLWITSTYIVVCVGAGVLAELLRRERKAAEDMALTDVLTDLPNRRHANVFLDAAFSAAVRGQPVSVVLFDLDHFKKVNDRFGHRSGDAVIRRVGAILREVTRRMDLSARWGGEEFITILARCPASGAVSFAERVQRELREEVFPWGTLTISAGVAEFETGMGSPELLIAAADQALYAAKEQGRNRCVVASVRMAGVGAGTAWQGPGGGGVAAEEPVRTRLVPPSEAGGALTAVHPRAAEDLPGGSERILIVDDNDSARVAIAKILTRLGYSAKEVADGEKALAWIRSGSGLDLLLTDLIMPGMSGFTLTERVEHEFGPTRVLYMSGEFHGAVSWGGAPGSLVGFLEKPMTPADLAKGVRKLLDMPLERRAPV